MSLPPALSAPGLSRASLAPLPGTHRLGRAPSRRGARHQSGGRASSPVHQAFKAPAVTEAFPEPLPGR